MAAKKESEASETQQTGHSFELKQDGLIEKLVPDPATPPDAMVLSGLVGRSTKAGYWRLYLTPQLNDYVEFSEKDVLHHQQFPPALSPLGGTLIWIKGDAKLQHTQTTIQQAQGQFLQGNIAAKFLSNVGIESHLPVQTASTHFCVPITRWSFLICSIHLCPL